MTTHEGSTGSAGTTIHGVPDAAIALLGTLTPKGATSASELHVRRGDRVRTVFRASTPDGADAIRSRQDEIRSALAGEVTFGDDGSLFTWTSDPAPKDNAAMDLWDVTDGLYDKLSLEADGDGDGGIMWDEPEIVSTAAVHVN